MISGYTNDKYHIEFFLDDKFEYLLETKWYVRLEKSGKVGAIRSNEKINGKHKTILLHRKILKISDKNIVIDHIDGNPLNNRLSNLRICSQNDNNKNASIRKDNTSGYKGVYFDKISNKWKSSIQSNKKRIILGLFNTPEEAYAAYCEASKKYHGEYGRVK